MKFKKKSDIIEAEQWFEVSYDRKAGHGITPEDMPIYHLGIGYYRRPEDEFSGKKLCPHCEMPLHIHGYMDFLEGGGVVCPGDVIITEVSGKRYPCKPEIFEMTYEDIKE